MRWLSERLATLWKAFGYKRALIWAIIPAATAIVELITAALSALEMLADVPYLSWLTNDPYWVIFTSGLLWGLFVVLDYATELRLALVPKIDFVDNHFTNTGDTARVALRVKGSAGVERVCVVLVAVESDEPRRVLEKRLAEDASGHSQMDFNVGGMYYFTFAKLEEDKVYFYYYEHGKIERSMAPKLPFSVKIRVDAKDMRERRIWYLLSQNESGLICERKRVSV